MRHAKKYRRLNRTSGHRQSLLRNMVSSLIRHDRIKTTLPKAKEVRKFADKMVTLAKRGDAHAEAQARAFLREHVVTVPKLFGEMAERYQNRPGGYTRIHKLGYRDTDHASMAIIEYVDAPDDIRYDMLIKTLARNDLNKILKVSSESIEQGQGNIRSNRIDKKRRISREKAQLRLAKNMRKFMKTKNIGEDELKEVVEQERDRLIRMGQEKEDFYIQDKIRRKGGRLSYYNLN
ncbi:18_t:CDS:2 [Paraglomus brasilianum]|uniref:18_t:CDS:1 n=1 Tax=Paraglomus brasilianum TaxID=144538 RepID=A0A9N9BCF8_9GLOM|nr:18_t:CDS:2 [Paraglomus brasilianum]